LSDLFPGAVCIPCLLWCTGECTSGTGRKLWSVTNSHIDRSESSPSEGKQPCSWHWLHAEGNKWYVWLD